MLACKSMCHQSVAERPLAANPVVAGGGCALSDSDEPPDTSDNSSSFTERLTYEDWNCYHGNTKNTLECMGHDTSFLNDHRLESKEEAMKIFRNNGWNVYHLPDNMNFDEIEKFVPLKVPMIVSIKLEGFNEKVEHVVGIVNSQIVDGAYDKLHTIPFTQSNMHWCAGSKFRVASEAFAIFPCRNVSKTSVKTLKSLIPIGGSKIVCLSSVKNLPPILQQRNIIELKVEQFGSQIKTLSVGIKKARRSLE